MYGSVAQARAYATKEDTRVEGPWEFGLMSSVGKRRGLEEAVDCVKAGMSLSKVAEEFSLAWVAHGRGLTSLRQQLEARRGPSLLRTRGPGGMGAMGAFRDGEEPFRSSPLARRLLEGAGEASGGTATRGRRPWSLTTSRTTRCPW